ncbi:MAG: dihydroorotate dehydrogenase electron transfer subunit [Spirochaetia bacterium]|nr:dihydroorotate dehydrogenase electron transfer subunit [Spirochaetia bacterium]
MVRIDAELLSNRRVADGYFELRFRWPAGAGKPVPGQFLTIQARDGSDPLLRRPFAFATHDGAREEASLVIQERGTATGMLAALEAGAQLDLLGPLGAGFDPETLVADARRGETPVLVAGGIGVGPMLFLRAALDAAGVESRFVLGARSGALVPEILLPRGPGVEVRTDDGSFGTKGTAADAVAALAADGPVALCACGPKPMMAALDRIAAERGWKYRAAVEEWMACGVGACMGCAVPLKGGGYARACADGPVLDGRAVKWD